MKKSIPPIVNFEGNPGASHSWGRDRFGPKFIPRMTLADLYGASPFARDVPVREVEFSGVVSREQAERMKPKRTASLNLSDIGLARMGPIENIEQIMINDEIFVKQRYDWSPETLPRKMHAPGPIPMVLHCPNCGEQHIDGPNEAQGWHNPPHRSHKCLECGVIWRPADVATTGVEKAETHGKADTWVFGWLRHDGGPESPVPTEFYVEYKGSFLNTISPAGIADWRKITKYRLHARSDRDLMTRQS